MTNTNLTVQQPKAKNKIMTQFNEQEFLNGIYDLLAQNDTDDSDIERDMLTELVDHVDTGRGYIQFKLDDGSEYQLRLVKSYAPAPKVHKITVDFQD